MFTRKHYKAIAELVKEQVTHSDGGHAAAILIGHNLADYFEKDNPRFDRDRFLAACGL